MGDSQLKNRDKTFQAINAEATTIPKLSICLAIFLGGNLNKLDKDTILFFFLKEIYKSDHLILAILSFVL
jgi:hypothetical protein